jgi:hypothetical protein
VLVDTFARTSTRPLAGTLLPALLSCHLELSPATFRSRWFLSRAPLVPRLAGPRAPRQRSVSHQGTSRCGCPAGRQQRSGRGPLARSCPFIASSSRCGDYFNLAPPNACPRPAASTRTTLRHSRVHFSSPPCARHLAHLAHARRTWLRPKLPRNRASTLQSSRGPAILCATVRCCHVSIAPRALNSLDALWYDLSGSRCSCATHASTRQARFERSSHEAARSRVWLRKRLASL